MIQAVHSPFKKSYSLKLNPNSKTIDPLGYSKQWGYSEIQQVNFKPYSISPEQLMWLNSIAKVKSIGSVSHWLQTLHLSWAAQ